MADKTVEFSTAALDKAIDGLCGFLKNSKDKASADLESCFKKYLKKASTHYNKTKTLVSKETPRAIIGKNEIYVNVNVKYEDDVIDTYTVEPLLRLDNHILITGTGGAGKTMLMKYLFLNTIKNETYIPVLVRLNKISKQPVENISIYELIYSAIGEFSDSVSDTAFKHSLEKGKYLFLFDGYDEIMGSHSIEASIAINDFCKNYPDNPCIVTSRPGLDYSQFKDFTFVEMLPLDKEQAVELASNLGRDDEKTREFCKQLDEKLFDYFKEKEDTFAENPLLLSMMFLTFLENGSVPDRIIDFYDKTYNALYNNHDNFKDGYFKRTFESSLKADEFKKVFTHFCFQTYMAQKYSFNEDEIIDLIEKSLVKYEIEKSQAKNYLKDLETAVCLLIKDGTDYIFAHRSFQTYFAAIYTERLDDEKQKKLFNKLFFSGVRREEYIEILFQLMDERFAINAFEDKLREFGIDNPITEHLMINLIKKIYCEIWFSNSSSEITLYFSDAERFFGAFAIYIFLKYNRKVYYDFVSFSSKKIELYFLSLYERVPKNEFDDAIISEIEKSNVLNKDEKRELYLIAIKESEFELLLQEAHCWLKSLDEKRAKLENASFDEDFFENL